MTIVASESVDICATCSLWVNQIGNFEAGALAEVLKVNAILSGGDQSLVMHRHLNIKLKLLRYSEVFLGRNQEIVGGFLPVKFVFKTINGLVLGRNGDLILIIFHTADGILYVLIHAKHQVVIQMQMVFVMM